MYVRRMCHLPFQIEQAFPPANCTIIEPTQIRRKHDWEDDLRQKTGVHGFSALYEVLGLPTNKLANKRTIKQAYHKLSLVWHPDKQNGPNSIAAAQLAFAQHVQPIISLHHRSYFDVDSSAALLRSREN